MKPRLDFNRRTYIMGILNITPDSFSGDGLLSGEIVNHTVRLRAQQFIAAGADILDIGGESTRPCSQPVSAHEETARVLPVIKLLAAEHPDAILSVDTYKAPVAEAALRAGAHWVNDIWALRADPSLAETAARHAAPIILMHNRSKPTDAHLQERLGGRYVGVQYEDLLGDITQELLASVEIARQAGILPEDIILDPGVGFGKTVEQNLELIRRLDEFKALGFPILLGPSRKSFIGYTLDLPPDQRIEGTLAACVLAVQRGVNILRVHDVEPVVRAVRMAEAILHNQP